MKIVDLPVFIRNAIDNVRNIDDDVEPLEKIDESLTPNMRALRLVMSISEQLLAQGVPASDIVHMAIGITSTYCKRRVHLDISSTMFTISQDRGDDREPLTMIRTIVLKDANYQTIQALQSLALEIRDKHLPLDEAEKRVDDILNKPKRLSRWVIYSAGGMVSAGTVLLYNGKIEMMVLAFIVGFLVTGMLRWLGRIGMTTFFSQILASLCITLVAAYSAWASTVFNLDINATLLVISGIVLLVAGMMIVGAFQDAIDEYYITANARLLKVAFATGGIVVGVSIGLYITTRLGISFPATPDQLTMASPQIQYIGALVIAAAFAARNHAPLFGTIIAGSVGMLGWAVSRVMIGEGFSIIIASGIAASFVGLMATFVSRFWKFPSMAIIAAGIVPLVPGLSLYNGLMGIVEFPIGDPQFMYAMSLLIRAVMIGLAIAAGATFGNLIGRPVRRRFVKLYNRLPRRRLSRPNWFKRHFHKTIDK